MPIIDRLLYPLSFNCASASDPVVYLFHIVLCVVAIAATLMLGVVSHRFGRMMFANRHAVLLTGLGGTAGVCLIAALDFSAPLSSFLIGAGAMLFALYLPVHFLFWSHCFARSGAKTVLTDAALSFALAALVFGLLTTLGIGVLGVAAAAPLVSGLLGFAHLRAQPDDGVARAELPACYKSWIFIVVIVLILLSDLAVVYFNHSARLQGDLPFRSLIFWGETALLAVIAFLYSPRDRWLPSTVSSFIVVSLAFIGMLLLAIFASGDVLNVGTVPLNLAAGVLIGFGWLLVVREANRKQRDLALTMALYLAFVLLSRFVKACFMYQENYVTLLADSIDLVFLVLVITFVVVCLVIAVLLGTFMKMGKKPAGGEVAPGRVADDRAAGGQGAGDRGAGGQGAGGQSVAEAGGLPGHPAPQHVFAQQSAIPSAIPPTVSERAMEDALRTEALERALLTVGEASGLSARETDVARLALRNYGGKAIAKTLFLSENTVYSHLKHIYQKTGVHSRQEFVELIERSAADAH